jgi:hypothetical protein
MPPNSSSGHRRGGGRGGGGRGRGQGSSVNGDSGHGRIRGRGGVTGHGNSPINNRTRGVCHFYWSTGACDHGFDCTYKHEARAQVSSSATPSTDYIPDFFSLEGLAVNNGSALDERHTLSPSQAHNHLKPYLSDNFVFRDAINIEGFSRILASVNSRNRTWVRRTPTTSSVY